MSNSDSRVVYVSELPACDICGNTARYDALTKLGSWGNLCQQDWLKLGTGLGTGKGQLLMLDSQK
jgi:hypothetical protein